MGKIAPNVLSKSLVDVITSRPSGHNVKKVRGTVILEEMEEFEKGFPEGTYVEPTTSKDPKIRVAELFKYCKAKGVEPKDLTDKEREQFLYYD